MNIAQSSVSQRKLAAKWNERFPVGTNVRYWTGERGVGPGKTGKTRSDAQLLGENSRGEGGHTAVVWIEGHAGCIALTHVQPEGGI
jgi:hypothetical protein